MPPRVKKPRETAIQTRCLEALRADGFRVERINSGRAMGFHGGVIQLASKGTPDLLVLWPYLWIEVKRPGKKPSAEQEEWHAWARDIGVPVVVVSSPEEAVASARSKDAT
jgi:hypothetical protein